MERARRGGKMGLSTVQAATEMPGREQGSRRRTWGNIIPGGRPSYEFTGFGPSCWCVKVVREQEAGILSSGQGSFAVQGCRCSWARFNRDRNTLT